VNTLDDSASSVHRCRVIVALDDNHNGDPDVARRLIDAAREAGADGVKFRRSTVAMSAVRQILDRPSPHHNSLGPTYRKALERVDLPVEVLARLSEYAEGLEVFLAPYDLGACRGLNGIPFAAWKVDSPLATHLPLLEVLGSSGRAVVAAVGGCTRREIEEMLNLLAPAREVTLVHALQMNPFTAGILDVAYLVALRRFGRPVGYADNSSDISLSLTAVLLGATIVEKPLTLDRATPGLGHATSLAPHELEELVRKVRALEEILVSETLRSPLPAEMDELEWSRVSIVASRSIPRGTVITRDMLTLKAPFGGLSPGFLQFLEGRRALYDIREDEFLTFGMVEL